MDDVTLLSWDKEVEGNFWKICKHLELCSDNGISFNQKKFAFAQDTNEYVGFEITRDIVNPRPTIIGMQLLIPIMPKIKL